jgi:hypothetical protein
VAAGGVHCRSGAVRACPARHNRHHHHLRDRARGARPAHDSGARVDGARASRALGDAGGGRHPMRRGMIVVASTQACVAGCASWGRIRLRSRCPSPAVRSTDASWRCSCPARRWWPLSTPKPCLGRVSPAPSGTGRGSGSCSVCARPSACRTAWYRPRIWQAAIIGTGAGDTKQRSIGYVHRLHPWVDLTPGKTRVAHDGIADAVCIAEWGQKKRPVRGVGEETT